MRQRKALQGQGKSMKRAQYNRRGPVPQDVIDVLEFTLPPLTAGQALVEVLAAPINPSDVLTLTGDYGSLPPLPAVGGNEGVGRVLEVATDVPGLSLGQTVLLPVGCGTWTTHLIADARELMPLPGDADAQQLAMLAVNPPTAHLLLSEFVELQSGDWIMQNAANSAVGHYLAQLAHKRGIRTVNVVRNPDQEVAGDVVLVDAEDLSDRVRTATGGAAIRLGVDAVGGAATERMARSLAPGATLVTYGAMSGESCAVSAGSLIFRDIHLRGFWLARWFKITAPQVRAALLSELAALIANGTLSAPVQASYGMDEIKAAVAAAAAGRRSGKILLLPNGP